MKHPDPALSGQHGLSTLPHPDSPRQNARWNLPCAGFWRRLAVCVGLMTACSTTPVGLMAQQDQPAAAQAAPQGEASSQSPPGTSEASSGQPSSAPAGTAVPAGASPDAAPGAPGAEPPAEAPPIAIPLQPYQVHIEVSFAQRGSLSASQTVERVHEISDSVSRVYGNMWQAEVRVSDWLLPGNRLQLENLTSDGLHERYGESPYHKVMLTTVEDSAGGFLVSCREYDVRVQDLTPVVTAFTFDARAIAAEAARLMRDCFRPVAFLSGPAKGTDVLEFYLQAGELVPPDPSAAQLAHGDVMRPFLRHMDRRDPTKLRLLQKLELTYIRVTDFNQELTATGLSSADEDVVLENAVVDPDASYVDRGRLQGVLISHGAAPFGGRGRNVEQIALRQRPMADSSEIQLVLKQREDRPLVCYRVDKVAKLRYRDESDVPSERLVSDREGRIRIDVDPDHPTFWLYVYSGSLLLARVPYAPGLQETDTIRLPDDSIRLGVEGELYLFRDQLVDVVAQQAVFKGIAKQAAAQGDTERLESAVSDLAALPGRKEFEAQLNAIRRPALDRAAELRNRSAERTVKRLCDAMASSLEKFFASDKQVRQMQEIQQLRNLAAQKAGRPAGPTE